MGGSELRRPLGFAVCGSAWTALGLAPVGNLSRSRATSVAGSGSGRLGLRMRHFDVAPRYGLGLAEERLAQLLGHLETKPTEATAT